ncbi:MAG: hypothetical protein IKE75_00905 [Bacilli bacterium]|nr:hypothetical protein [Bacilli bacterium]
MLNKIKFSYREADNQSNLFTQYHTRFKCKIKYCGLSFTFPYQCNTEHDIPNLVDCLRAIISDMDCYDSCGGDMSDFNWEFGYTDDKAYKGCKRISKALHRLFTDEEINKIYKEIDENEGF